MLTGEVVKVVEDTICDTIQATRQITTGGPLLEAAIRYAEERHWDVVPGTWLQDDTGGSGFGGLGTRCSCGEPGCPEPGAHPAGRDWAVADGSTVAVRRMWTEQPHASIMLPTGRTFDAIDVPEVAGCLALARMERMKLSLGPVLCTPRRRLIFLVSPGAADKIPDLLRRLGRPPASLDLTVHGVGGYIPAPPTRLTGGASVQWVRTPTALNRWLPDAEQLLSPLAYACGQEAAATLER